jgi:2-dehydropantoate 2-reductase
MKIAIFGTGGVGGYFGGLLAHAGHDVTFLARGKHLEAIQKQGLIVNSVNGDFHISPAQATDDPSAVGPVDYIIVAVKHYHLAPVAPQIKPMIGPTTTVVPLLNGVDAHELLAQVLGKEHVVGGLCSIVSMIEAPGIIRQASKLRRVVVGELDRSKSARVEKIIRAWSECGAEAIHAEDIYVAIWTKFLFITSISGVAALARANMGEVLGCNETRQLFIDAMAEVEALARAQNIQLPENIVQTTVKFVESMEPTSTASMQRDVEAGKPFELEAFSGKIVRLGAQLGVPTPVHRTIYGLLLPALKRAQAAVAQR